MVRTPDQSVACRRARAERRQSRSRLLLSGITTGSPAIGSRLSLARRRRAAVRRNHHTDMPRRLTASRIATSSWRHLVCAGDQLTIMAALFEQRLGVRFLEIPGADLARRNLRGDCQHRQSRSVTIEQAIDQVQIAMPAAPGTDGELTGQMRLGACPKAATSSC